MGFPRKIVLTREYGSSFFQNLNMNLVMPHVNPYDIVESEALIDACEQRLRWHDAKQRLIDSGFPKRYIEPLEHWGWERGEEILVDTITVTGPYMINDYDGREYVIEKDDVSWRT